MGTMVDHICKLIEDGLDANDLIRVISFCESRLDALGIELVSRVDSSSPPRTGKAGVKPGKRPPRDHAVVVVRKFVKCGKPTCSKCPHGPYYYSAQRTGRGKTKWKYLGTTITGAAQ
ncbi:MAG: hypothetical protein HZA04_02775 [Nitrospinae bacterium]|nr:hypothetical protein [Nitrospinota bacterium]